MEKGLDSLFDLTYDYDISFADADQSYETKKQEHDFAVCFARFMCLKAKYTKSFSEKHMQSKFDNFVSDDKLMPFYISNKENITIKQRAINEAFKDVQPQLLSLAHSGNLKALALYLSCDKEARNNVLFDKKINAINNKEAKTAEEWEVLAASHYYDTPDVRFDNMGQMLAKIWLICKDNYVACEAGAQELYEETMHEAHYFSNQFFSSEYAKALQKAMLGYYAQSFAGENRLKNMMDFLRLSQGGADLLINKEIFSEYSGGKCFRAQDFLELVAGKNKINNINYDGKKKYSLDQAFKIFSSMFSDYNMQNVEEIYKNMIYALACIDSENNFLTKNTKDIEKGYNIFSQIARRKLYLAEKQKPQTFNIDPETETVL
ncbi:MAG: hypothetical protein IJS74_00375 [Clostridia bacterium]|nr:hypothetical protein [Clostridia bacterium]